MLKLLTTCWHCITLWIVGNVNMHSRTRDIHTRWAKFFVASHSPPYGETPNLVQQPCNKSHIVVFTQDIFVILFAWDRTRIRWDITTTKHFGIEIWNKVFMNGKHILGHQIIFGKLGKFIWYTWKQVKNIIPDARI